MDAAISDLALDLGVFALDNETDSGRRYRTYGINSARRNQKPNADRLKLSVLPSGRQMGKGRETEARGQLRRARC